PLPMELDDLFNLRSVQKSWTPLRGGVLLLLRAVPFGVAICQGNRLGAPSVGSLLSCVPAFRESDKAWASCGLALEILAQSASRRDDGLRAELAVRDLVLLDQIVRVAHVDAEFGGNTVRSIHPPDQIGGNLFLVNNSL